MFKKFKYLFLLIFLLIPVSVFAEKLYDITYEDAKVVYTIDETQWKEKSSNEEWQYIDRMWNSDCGSISIGHYDFYSELSDKEKGDLTREDLNYDDVFSDDSATAVKPFIEKYEKTYNLKVSNYKYKYYNMKFLYLEGTTERSNIRLNFKQYITINNGYAIIFQYMAASGQSAKECEYKIEDLVKTAKPIGDFDDVKNGFMIVFYFIISVIITLISYMIYPFTRVVLLKRKYNSKEANTMAIWNSIIVGLSTAIIVTIFYKNGYWSGAPAFLYYCINRKIWVSKNSKSNNKTNDKKQKRKKNNKIETNTNVNKNNINVCSNCGFNVRKNARKCPRCGEIFEREIKSEINIDDKFDSLNKLKKLLDDGIITKEEFRKEKQKILDGE